MAAEKYLHLQLSGSRMKNLMPLIRLTVLFASYSFSIWASWQWICATYLRLPAEAPVPLHYGLVLLLFLLPFFVANYYLWMLSTVHREVIPKLFPWFKPTYYRIRNCIEKNFPRLGKNLFWGHEDPPDNLNPTQKHNDKKPE
ncbi:MAG: hypothetical protein HND56_07485 [Pseudomonadota bacterium]|nr:MAG: hypothetical protein HND56_07485 [Pseudomonadota bacterium]